MTTAAPARGSTGRAVWRLSRTLRFGLYTALCVLLSMGVSYGVVRVLARSYTLEQAPAPDAVAEGAALRDFSNGLAAVAGAWVQRRGQGAQPEEMGQWLAREFRPRLDELRRRMVRTEVSSPALPALMRAADALAVAAGNPGDTALRRAALAEVLEAQQRAEQRIVELGVESYLTERAVVTRPVF